MDTDWIAVQEALKNYLEEDFTYWVHEGMVLRSPMGENDFLAEILGPGGWAEAL